MSTEGDTQLADLYLRRFRSDFRPAFDAWLAQDPLHDVDAIASPLSMPEYHPAGFAHAERTPRSDPIRCAGCARTLGERRRPDADEEAPCCSLS